MLNAMEAGGSGQHGWSTSTIRGLLRRTLTAHPDSRGSFMELWRSSWTDDLGSFRQANLSRSGAGVLRGMHFHERQDDLWVVIDGRAFVAAVDLRGALEAEGGPTTTEAFELAAGGAVYLPKGVAHGFYAMEPLALLYLVTTEFDGTDEHGFAWDDPDAAIPWPTRDPLLSDRDRSNPALAVAIGAARQRGQSAGR